MKKYLPLTTFQKKDLNKRTTQRVMRGLPKILIFLLLVSFLVPLASDGYIVRIENPLKANTFWEFIDNIINFIFYLAIAIAPIMFIIAGFWFIGAAGDPEKIKTAKQMILWTLVGLVIVFSAKGLIALFQEIFEITPIS